MSVSFFSNRRSEFINFELQIRSDRGRRSGQWSYEFFRAFRSPIWFYQSPISLYHGITLRKLYRPSIIRVTRKWLPTKFNEAVNDNRHFLTDETFIQLPWNFSNNNSTFEFRPYSRVDEWTTRTKLGASWIYVYLKQNTWGNYLVKIPIQIYRGSSVIINSLNHPYTEFCHYQ